ncbi:hypothetical protein JCM8097_002624 [Rhodosporidiobolus ruineniae]
MAGFRDEDDADIGDLLAPSSGFGSGGPASMYASTSFGAPAEEEDLDANPFADMESSRAALPPMSSPFGVPSSAVEEQDDPTPQSPFYSSPPMSSSTAIESAYASPSAVYDPTPVHVPVAEEDQTPFQPEADFDLPPPVPVLSQQESVYSGEPATPSDAGGGFASPSPRARGFSFAREAAPEPETPAVGQQSAYSAHSAFQQQPQASPVPPPQPQHAPGDPEGFTYNPYARSPPRFSAFGSPSSPTSPSRSIAGEDGEGGFGTASEHRFGTSRIAGRADLSTLLGDAPGGSPRSRLARGGEGERMTKSAILPTRGGRETLGRKPGGGALAALLGMGGEEEDTEQEKKPRPVVSGAGTKKVVKGVPLGAGAAKEEKKQEETVEEKPKEVEGPENKVDEPAKEKEGQAVPTEEAKEEEAQAVPAEEAKEETVTPEDAPLPPEPTPSTSSSDTPFATAATTTPLPPSRSATPAQLSEPEPKPPLSRAASVAASDSPSIDSAGPNVPYESMVSPLETGETPRADGEPAGQAWPANKAVAGSAGGGIEEQLEGLKINTAQREEDTASPALSTATESTVPAPTAGGTEPDYQQYIFSDSTNNSPSESRRPSSTLDDASTSGFASVGGESASTRGFRAFNGSGDDGGFGGGGFADDADSLRGTYSRSVEVAEEENEADATVDSPATERTFTVDEPKQRMEREGSAPLPPLPPSVPSIQGSPRSTQLGGSLGPSFIITVGDPQTVGSALNPTSQHTVYTVRTRTTSSAFRKSDFSVLRRYSHFVWLYEALVQNNPGVIVPGMPEKHAIGRFGSEFVENRRLGLQAALNKIVAHPMLVGDPDLRLFLESDTFHIDIKQRKIDTSTSSENKGFLANLGSSFSGPKFVEHDEFFEQRKQSFDVFEAQLRSLIASLSSAAKARSALNSSIAELQSAFLALAQCDLSSTLRRLLDESAALQKKIFELAEQQAAQEEQMGGLVNVAESYTRLCASAKGVFGARIKAYHTWQAAESNLRKLQSKHEQAKRSGRAHSELLGLSVAEIAEDGSLCLVFGNQAERKMLDARHDFDDVSKLTKAEMARVDKEKVDDFKKALEEYADSLAARQRQVVAAWQEYHDLLVKAVEANTAQQQQHAPPAASSAAAAES